MDGKNSRGGSRISGKGLRPNYFIFIGNLKMGGREGNSSEPPMDPPLNSVTHYYFPFQFCNHLNKDERARCFTLIFFLMACGCSSSWWRGLVCSVVFM